VQKINSLGEFVYTKQAAIVLPILSCGSSRVYESLYVQRQSHDKVINCMYKRLDVCLKLFLSDQSYAIFNASCVLYNPPSVP